MSSDQWKTYRTRFLVKAKQLNSVLNFTDHLGRQHCGRKGDYLVESGDGVLSIARRQIFEDIYVPMSLPAVVRAQHRHDDISCTDRRGTLEHLAVDSMEIAALQLPKSEARMTPRRQLAHDPSRSRRKSPQPLRSPHNPARLELM